MISLRLAGRYPERTYTGREDKSKVAKWVFNWVTTLGLVFFFGSAALDFFGVSWSPQIWAKRSATATPYLSPDQVASTMVAEATGPTPTPLSVSVSVSYPTAIPLQATYTPYPTLTPYPTHRPILGDRYAVGYSYYWPPMGPPSCALANWQDGYCKDTTASGLKWSDYPNRAVAMPLQWRDFGYVDLGDTVRVHQPPDLVGDYLVIDWCGDCIKEEGHIYIDFLTPRAHLNWTVPVLIEIIRKD